jgi:hypothetical protein
MSDRTAEESDADLRELWTSQGVSPEQQDEILADITRKASPAYLDRVFPKSRWYFSYRKGYAFPPSATAEDQAHLAYVWAAYGFLLNTPELRRQHVTYPEMAALMRAYSMNTRTEWYAAFLERLSAAVS